MNARIRRDGGFEYVEEGNGPVLLLLHGLFGALSNWEHVFETFSKNHRVIIPIMPIYKKTNVQPSVDGLAHFIKSFVLYKGLPPFVALGNSLGGHIALVYSMENPGMVKGLALTASSGLFESGMGSTFPRRGNYDYIKKRVEFTFYDPATASKDLIDEVFGIVNDNYSALRILQIARAAQRQNLRKTIPQISIPSILIWGLNDNITPPVVAHEFHKLLKNSELCFVDECGHAPMMEKPGEFNASLGKFLERIAN